MSSRVSSFFSRLGEASKYAIGATPTGVWEGHTRNRLRNRPRSVKTSQDVYLDFGVREDLLSEARSLCQTFGICRRILRNYSNYVVGSCKARWNTADEAWNENVEARWISAMEIMDSTGRRSLPSMARIGVQSIIRDGDIFFHEIESGGFLKLDAIEADRVGNNITGAGINIDTENVIGGVNVDSKGRPVRFRVNDRGLRGTFRNPRDIPVHQMIHVFDSDRFDAYRGVTHFAAALDDIRDMKGIKDSEKVAQHTFSRLALLVRNAIGQNPNGINLLNTDTDNNGDTISTEAIGEGAVKYQFNGDSMEALQSSRPADSWFRFQEHLVRSISVSIDLPFEFVWHMSGLPGPAIRLMSRQAQRTFAAFRKNVLEGLLLNRVASRWVNLEMKSGRIPFNPNWHEFEFEQPPHLSIDVGRESSANLAEMKANVLSGKEIAEERGKDIYEVIRQIEREKAYKKEVAQEFGNPIEAADGAGSEFESINEQVNAYGIAVRAGVITPQKSDEEYFRKLYRLPTASGDITRAWKDDKGVRRPITLVGPDGKSPLSGQQPKSPDEQIDP